MPARQRSTASVTSMPETIAQSSGLSRTKARPAASPAHLFRVRSRRIRPANTPARKRNPAPSSLAIHTIPAALG